MQSMNSIGEREAAILKIAESEEDVAALRQHLKEIVEGTAFKGSHRSGQFLCHIVDQAIAGNFDSLKERVIGVELFARSPSYDTGEDAIVRVTASDVRKRLLQHYGVYGSSSDFRLTLPLGSYLPEIKRERVDETRSPDRTNLLPEPLGTFHDSPAAHHKSPSVNEEPFAVSVPLPHKELVHPNIFGSHQRIFLGIALVALNLALWSISWNHPWRTGTAAVSVLPWSALFNPSHATHVITSDPNIAEVQEITGGQISVSDYANRNYLPEPNKLTPEQDHMFRFILRGNGAASVDTPIAVSIAKLAPAGSKQIDVTGAREIRLPDLKTNDNFVFLGSPRSNPWFGLFSDQLDFRFVFDEKSKLEFIRNIHPRPNEQSTYVPTAPGWATGQSFAIIALVQNLDQDGQVLLLAGADGEGTEAAGRLVSDPAHFSPVLQRCGIDSGGPVRHFEVLLHLNTMAGSPSNAEVVACHLLPGPSVQKP